MPRYNHALEVAFEVVSERQDGSDITPEMLRAALLKRVEGLDKDGAWIEACFPIFDTYETEG